MGDRYILIMECPICANFDDDVPFAPTCGFTEWKCDICGHTIDLCKFTGISYEDASNADLIAALCANIVYEEKEDV